MKEMGERRRRGECAHGCTRAAPCLTTALIAQPLPCIAPFLSPRPPARPPARLPAYLPPPHRPPWHTEDIDFKYPLQQACVTEVALLCRDVAHGHARVVRCLEGHLESDRMSQECREAVEKDEVRGVACRVVVCTIRVDASSV